MNIPLSAIIPRGMRDAVQDVSARVHPRGIISNLEESDPLEFSTGLTGVDQVGNYLWVNVLLLTFLVVVVITIGVRCTHKITAHLRHISLLGDVERQNRQRYWAIDHNSWWPWLKKHLLYAPLWNKRHNAEIRLSSAVSMGTLPSRFHMVLIVAYWACNIAYCLCLPWDRPESYSVLAALRGRSGSLSALNLIPTILFALKNNPLIWLLHVSYDTFNLFHRWIARLCIVEAIVHTLCWFFNTYNGGKMAAVADSLKEPSYTWGMVGTVSFIVLAIQAWSPLRHAFYETFLNIHRLSAILAIVGAYYHFVFHLLPQKPWVEIAFTLWILEACARPSRIIYRCWRLRERFSRITVEALDEEACRVTIHLRRPWKIRPGQHVHLWMPAFTFPYFWAMHPFSIAWTDKRSTSSLSEKLPMSEKDVDIVRTDDGETTTSISLVVRACSGFTRKLYNRAASSPGHTFETWGGVDGPYGADQSLASYGTVVLFAAGVGITHQLLYVRELLQGIEDGTVATKKITLVWSVQKTEMLNWVRPWMNEILPMKARREHLKVLLHITKRMHPRDYQPSRSISMFPERPNPGVILDQQMRDRVGAIVVTCCGPGQFSDNVRDAVRRRVDLGSVDYVEEAFSY